MKKNLLNKIKNNGWLILTFLLSTIVICFIYTFQKIAPFGSNSMLDVDFYHQYGPLLNELYDRVKSGESLLYSFNTGLGIPFYRNFMNYLSSPFNILLFLFKKENIVMAFSIIIALKAIFASCTMSFYLKKTFNKSGILASIFGVFYAFSGYFCSYYWNIMWLDGMVFLPIIAYGINKLIDDKKTMVYTISLAVMLFANYFIAYMICIFCVFYFLGYLIYKCDFNIKDMFKNNIKTFIMFALSSILAAGLVSFMLLPLFYSLSSISATSGVFPKHEMQFSITDFMFNHISSVNRTVFASDILPLPNVYPGLLTLVSISLLFINKKINLKFKVLAASSLVIMFFVFNVNSLDFIMHAFHVPNDLPWRYSFLYVFILVIIGYYSFSRIKEVSVVKISISFALIIIMVLVSAKVSFANIDDKRAVMCIILLMSYYLACLIYMYYDKYRYGALGLIMVIMMVEMIYSINVNWNIDHEIKTFMSDKNDYQNLISYLKEKDNDLYRVEKTNYLTLNDGAWYDYYGVSTFTSMAYEDTAKSQRKFGMSGNDINSYYYQYYQTPIYNTIFNVKYILGDYLENDYYTPIKTISSYNATWYKYSSSIAYAVENDIKDFETISYNPFYNQSNFTSLATKVDNIYKEVPVIDISGGLITSKIWENTTNGDFSYQLDDGSDSLTFVLDNKEERNVYIYVGGANVSSISVDDEYYSLTSDEYYTIDVGKKRENIEVNIKLSSNDDGMINFYAYYIDNDNFNEFYDAINDEKLNVTRYSDTLIEGNLIAKDDKTVFTSISYDDGWSVYVDDKMVKTYKIDNAYLAFDISRGNHEIKMRYYPKGMLSGLIITMVSFIIFIGLMLKEKINIFKKNKKDEFIV